MSMHARGAVIAPLHQTIRRPTRGVEEALSTEPSRAAGSALRRMSARHFHRCTDTR